MEGEGISYHIQSGVCFLKITTYMCEQGLYVHSSITYRRKTQKLEAKKFYTETQLV